MCVYVCLVWVGMPGGNCSMSGMLLGSSEGNPEDNGSMWKTLTCFAWSLHCLIRLRTTAFMYGQCGQVGTSRALKKDANSPDTAGIPKNASYFAWSKRWRCDREQEIMLTPSLSALFLFCGFNWQEWLFCTTPVLLGITSTIRLPWCPLRKCRSHSHRWTSRLFLLRQGRRVVFQPLF